MAPIVKPCPSRRPVVFVVALALTGCGVAGYEKQMQEAEVHVLRFDDENRLLGPPLDVPAALPKAPTISLYLRPPKGVKIVSNKDEIPYHYAGTSGVCSDLYLAISADQDKAQKLIEEKCGTVGLNWQPVEVSPPGRPPLAFKAVEFFEPQPRASGAAVFVAYVHQTAGFPAVGVVFRVLKSNREAAGASLKMSMETYAEQGDAYKARFDYGKRP